MSTVEYDLEGDSSSLVSSLEAAIRELTEATKAATETKQAVRKLTDEQKAAAAATKAAADEAKKSGDAYNGVVKILKQFGFGVSDVTDTLDDLGEGLEKVAPALGDMGVEALGAGVALTGAAVAVGGLAYGLVSLAESALEAKDRLEKMGVIVDSESADELESYAAGVRQLSVSLDKLEVSSGSKLAENIGGLETALAAFVVQLEPAKMGVGDLIGRLAQLGPLAFLVQEAFDSLFGDAQDVNRHLALQKQVHDEYVDELTDMAHVSKEATDKMLGDLKRQEEGEKRVGDTISAEAIERQKAAAAAEKATEQQYLSELKWGQQFYNSLQQMAKQDEQNQQKARDLEITWIKERAAAAEEAAREVGKKLDEETKDFEKQLKERQKLLKDSLVQSAQFLEETFSAVSDAVSQGYQDQVSAIDDQISKQQQLVDKLKNSDDAASKARVKAETDRLNGLEAEKKRIAYDEFVQEQDAAVGQALLQGAVAIVTAFAQLGPIGGAIASSFIGAMTATQVGIIEAQKPPAHDGAVMGADEFDVGNRRVRSGEAAVIFNQRAVQSGALEQAVRANRDERGGGSTQEVRLVLADAGRVVGELVARETRRPGSRLAAAFGGTGVVDPYGRAR